MASEGRREIEAARRRLAAARAQAASAAKALESVRALSEAAEKEVEVAEAFLEGAEERWQVVDVVDSEDEASEAEPKGREAVEVVDSEGESSGAEPGAARNQPARIHVEGCGIAELNGTYSIHRASRDDAKYYRKGVWEGRAALFLIYRKAFRGSSTWAMGPARGAALYYNGNVGDARPPRRGWRWYRLGQSGPGAPSIIY